MMQMGDRTAMIPFFSYISPPQALYTPTIKTATKARLRKMKGTLSSERRTHSVESVDSAKYPYGHVSRHVLP